tara:strand:- start:1769 stop:2464 length:696 start_codon:yes stop_codon:yes gene_type:complete
MAVRGDLPKPDLVIFADTGSEMPSTYRTIGALKEICDNAEIEFQIVQYGVLYEDYIEQEIIPTIGNSGCTDKYKIRPIRRYLRKHQDESGPKPWSEVWIGITTDEKRRMRESDVKWIKNKFPLIELNMSRDDCISWIKKYYPSIKVQKSGCFHCHFNRSKHWVDLKENHPHLFEIAKKMEQTAKSGRHKIKNGLYQNKSIDVFDYSHQLTDFGIEIYPVDFDCTSSGGCFL